MFQVRLTEQEYNYICSLDLLSKEQFALIGKSKKMNDSHFLHISEEQAKDLRGLF